MDDQEFHEAYQAADGTEAALYAVAMAINNLAYQIKCLGNGNASAIEAASVRLEEQLDAASKRIETVIFLSGGGGG